MTGKVISYPQWFSIIEFPPVTYSPPHQYQQILLNLFDMPQHSMYSEHKLTQDTPACVRTIPTSAFLVIICSDTEMIWWIEHDANTVVAWLKNVYTNDPTQGKNQRASDPVYICSFLSYVCSYCSKHIAFLLRDK